MKKRTSHQKSIQVHFRNIQQRMNKNKNKYSVQRMCNNKRRQIQICSDCQYDNDDSSMQEEEQNTKNRQIVTNNNIQITHKNNNSIQNTQNNRQIAQNNRQNTQNNRQIAQNNRQNTQNNRQIAQNNRQNTQNKRQNTRHTNQKLKQRPIAYFQILQLPESQVNLCHNHLQICAICLINWRIGQKYRILPCTHIFHHVCIKDWLVKKNQCPLCKNVVIGN